MTDEDLFRPLSAKITVRRQFSSGGRELTGKRASQGEAQRISAARARATRDRTRSQGDAE